MIKHNQNRLSQEISFNNQCDLDNMKNKIQQHKPNQPTYKQSLLGTQTYETPLNSQGLARRINELQSQLRKQREKSNQLQKRNQQLMNMLVSASQSSVKRNQLFITQIQRKIYNYKALKDLSSSNFSTKKQQVLKQRSRRTFTQSHQESTKIIPLFSKQSFSLRTKFDGDKQNFDRMNKKLQTQKSKYFYPNQLNDSNKTFRQKLKTDQSQSSQRYFVKTQFNNKFSILDPFTKQKSMKIFTKLQNKTMRT